jgi:hypothetical protein
MDREMACTVQKALVQKINHHDKEHGLILLLNTAVKW